MTSTRKTTSSSVNVGSLQGRTVGYLVVEDCEIFVPENYNAVGKQQVEIPLPVLERRLKDVQENGSKQDDAEKNNDGNNKIQSVIEPCRHSDLVLTGLPTHEEKQGAVGDENNNNTINSDGHGSNRPVPTLRIEAGAEPSFNGTMDDIKSKHHSNRQRSDAVLLVGAALCSQDLGHIRIKTIQVVFNGKQDAVQTGRQNDGDGNESPTNIGGFVKTRAAALLVTFSVHEIDRRPPLQTADHINDNGMNDSTKPRIESVPSTTPGYNRRFFSNRSRDLAPSTQLILSLMSSDWSALRAKLGSIMSSDSATSLSHSTPRRRTSLFPDNLSLHSVYQRLGTVSHLSGNMFEGMEDYTANDDTLTLPGLPDVVTHRIGMFLKAGTVHALRCTCKRLHNAMRGVVPGLKGGEEGEEDFKLYSHQIRSLLWMRMREAKTITENDLLRDSETDLSGLRKSHVDGDLHRAATGGATVVLAPKKRRTENSVTNQPSAVRVSQRTGDEMIVNDADPFARKVARGGLLCDEPGLGKTVTVLSLILQTMNLSTEEDEISELTEEQIFSEYWRESLSPQERTQELTTLFESYFQSSSDVYFFFDEAEKRYKKDVDYLHDVPNAICLKEIKSRVSSGYYSGNDSFTEFRQDVARVFENAIQHTALSSLPHMAAVRMNSKFDEYVNKFQEEKVAVANEDLNAQESKPAISALVDVTQKSRIQGKLHSSKGTLLVVPPNLVDHWMDQIAKHIDPNYCLENPGQEPITFTYTGTYQQRRRMRTSEHKVNDGTGFPFVFVDKAGTRRLPDPKFLAKFRIVVTTTQRFSSAAKDGSLLNEVDAEEEEKEKALQKYLDRRRSENDNETDGDDDPLRDFHDYYWIYRVPRANALLKIKWLRLVVDEGHSMAKVGQTSSTSFASWLNAERRWAITGTPTPENSVHNGLASLLHMTEYLQHDFFSHLRGGEFAWKSLIAQAWKKGYLSSFFRVRSLLSMLMVRHTKEDVAEIPFPNRKTVALPMSATEATSYNTLVCAVQSNILFASMECEGVESLLHQTQGRRARENLKNLRLLCVGGSRVTPFISPESSGKSLDESGKLTTDPTAKKNFEDFLTRVSSGQLSKCGLCNIMISTPLVCPSGDLACPECMDKTTHAASADQPQDKQLDRLQPAFTYKWIDNLKEEEEKEEKEFMIRKAAIQAANAGGAANAVGENQNNNLPWWARPRKVAHVCKYNPEIADGICTDSKCGKKCKGCCLVQTKRCTICYRRAKDCPPYESKTSYLINQLIKHLSSEEATKTAIRNKTVPKEFTAMGTKRSFKAVIFSQFRQKLTSIGDRLVRRFGAACIAHYWGQERKNELEKFKTDPKCFVVLLNQDGIGGLDISLVTHIWFVEPMWDPSVRTKVEGRAWRMDSSKNGANEPVIVETLVAKSTIEELMEESTDITTSPENGDEEDFVVGSTGIRTADQQAKVSFLLKNAKLVKPSSTGGLTLGGSKRDAVAQQRDSEEDGPSRKKFRSEDLEVEWV